MKNLNKQKIYAFIDSQNLNLSVRNDIIRKRKIIYKGWRLDFERFNVYIKAKYHVTKSFLFIGYRKENRNLYDRLNAAGYNLVFKPTLDSQGKTKGNVDAELVLHAVDKIRGYDKAVLVTGDGDFHCLVEYLIKKRKLYKVLIPNQHSYSSLLRKFKQYISFVNVLKNKLERK
ncbi:MAG: NYN domain-containing protein [Patescibacteria group bacterium]